MAFQSISEAILVYTESESSELITEDPELGSVCYQSILYIVKELTLIKRKKKRLNDELWLYSRIAGPEEPTKDKHYHEIYYCNRSSCTFNTLNAQRFRGHLQKKHHIFVAGVGDSTRKQAIKNTIVDIFGE